MNDDYDPQHDTPEYFECEICECLEKFDNLIYDDILEKYLCDDCHAELIKERKKEIEKDENI